MSQTVENYQRVIFTLISWSQRCDLPFYHGFWEILNRESLDDYMLGKGHGGGWKEDMGPPKFGHGMWKMKEHDDQSLDMGAPYFQRKQCIGYMMQYIYIVLFVVKGICWVVGPSRVTVVLWHVNELYVASRRKKQSRLDVVFALLDIHFVCFAHVFFC